MSQKRGEVCMKTKNKLGLVDGAEGRLLARHITHSHEYLDVHMLCIVH